MLRSDYIVKSMDNGLDEYICLVESGSIDPLCIDHLKCAIDNGADLDVVEYILQQGVSPNDDIQNAMDLILSLDYEYEPNDFTDSLITLLFEYGAKYDPYMLRYLNTETREHFLELERNVAVFNIKG